MGTSEWHYTEDDPDGFGLLEQLRASTDWSMVPGLWRGVIWLAMREADYTTNPRAKQKWKRRAARQWIFGGGLGYRAVCCMAGLDPVAVQERTRELVSE